MPDPHNYVDGNVTPALVKQLYKEAEAALKIVERIAGDLAIPTINQLRYAGNHLSRFINNQDKEELKKAANHCKRAKYDAYETGIVYFLDEIHNFGTDYRKAVISKVIPKWIDFQVKILEVVEFIRNKDEEKQDEQCRNNFEILHKIVIKITVARSDLNNTLKQDRYVFYGVLIAIITVVFVALNFFGINGDNILSTDIKAEEVISTPSK